MTTAFLPVIGERISNGCRWCMGYPNAKPAPLTSASWFSISTETMEELYWMVKA